MNIRFSVLFLVWAMVSGCSESTPRPPTDWLARTDSAGFYPLIESPDICSECISVEKILEFGDLDGSAAIQGTHDVLQDTFGRFWITQGKEIVVFDSAGQFHGTVGRTGRGPMEFLSPILVHTDSEGRVHVFDQANFRASVIWPDLQTIEEYRLPGGAVHTAVPLPGGTRYAVNSWLQTPKTLGFPLHIIQGDSVLKSFGAVHGDGMLTPFRARRELAVDPLGRVISIERHSYKLEFWTRDGERIGGLSGLRLNEKEVVSGRYDLEENPIPNRIWGVQMVGSDLLVVISQRLREDYEEHIVEQTFPNGIVALNLKEGSTYESVFRSRIEVIDLPSRMIIARQDREELLSTFVGDGLILENLTDRQLVPRLGIWRMSLDTGKVRPAQ